MENKYYTPEISEFHVGFEYEERHLGKQYRDLYVQRELTTLIFIHDSWRFGTDECRVKYLDSEDIQSLGFSEGPYFKKGRENDLVQIYNIESTDVWIIDTFTENTRCQLFKGVIKNKSELKKLLLQLEITFDK